MTDNKEKDSDNIHEHDATTPTEPHSDTDEEKLKQQARIQKKLEELRKRDPFIYR